MSFFKPKASPTPTPPVPAAAQPTTPVPSNAVMAQLLSLQRSIDQGFAKIERRIGRIERDLIDLKAHHGVQRRSWTGRANENDEPTAVVNADI